MTAATFVEREPSESLVEHMARNAEALSLTGDQRRRLDMALSLERQSVGTKQELALARTRASDMAIAVRTEVASDIDATIALAKARGEEVAAKAWNDAGARRVTSRDGLLSAQATGKLSKAEIVVCEAYRFLCESAAREGAVGSTMGDHVRSTDNMAAANGLLKAYAGVRLTAIDRAIAAADRRGRALWAMQRVVGRGEPLTTKAMGQSVREANWRALHLGIVVAGGMMRQVADLRRLLKERLANQGGLNQ